MFSFVFVITTNCATPITMLIVIILTFIEILLAKYCAQDIYINGELVDNFLVLLINALLPSNRLNTILPDRAHCLPSQSHNLL